MWEPITVGTHPETAPEKRQAGQNPRRQLSCESKVNCAVGCAVVAQMEPGGTPCCPWAAQILISTLGSRMATMGT